MSNNESYNYILGCIAKLETLSRENMNEDEVKIWYHELSRYSIAAIVKGFDEVYSTHVYKGLPKLASVKTAIEKYENEILSIQAQTAFCYVISAVEKYGYNNKPKFDDITELTLKNFTSWYEFCFCKIEKMEWLEKKFLEGWKKVANNRGIYALSRDEILQISRNGAESVQSIIGKMKLALSTN